MIETVRCAVCGRFVVPDDRTPSCTTSIRKHPVEVRDGRVTFAVRFPGVRFTVYFCATRHSDAERERAAAVAEAGILEALSWRRNPRGNLEPVIA